MMETVIRFFFLLIKVVFKMFLEFRKLRKFESSGNPGAMLEASPPQKKKESLPR